MSEVKPGATSGTPTPSLLRELLAIGKLVLGLGLIAFGCWRAFVCAWGPDESLLFAYRMTENRTAEQAAARKQHEKGTRELKRGSRTTEERDRERDRLDRELAQTLEEQPERDRHRYRVERWMELSLVVLAFVLGPGLFLAGRAGVRWPKLRRA